MNIIAFLIGILLLLLVITDFFHTTLSFQGSGPITRLVHRSKWKAVQFLARLFGDRMLRYGGLFLALSMLASWILLFWLGLFLVFHSDPAAVVSNDELERPANVIERIYFTGFVLSTLGLGDFKPGTDWAQAFTAVFSFSGFIFFTASMTYLLSISTAIVQKRSLAMTINDMGRSPQEIILGGWNGSDFSLLKSDLSALKQALNAVTQSHRIFPILHYFTTRDRRGSISLNIVRLDEALTIFLHQLQHTDTSSHKEAEQIRRSLDNFTEMVMQAMITGKNVAIPPPTTDRLEQQGLQVQDISTTDRDRIGERRLTLGGYLRFEGWKAKDL